MDYNANGISEVAIFNKKKLKQKYFNVPIDDIFYKFKVSGVGNRFIKIEKFFYYSDVIKAVQQGNKSGFEFLLEQIIIDPNMNKMPTLESHVELKERALANKANLKNKFINIQIGNKEYGFKIAGIGFKSIKIELYIGYDEIVKELSSGNKFCLEFIIMELIMGNEIDYEEFNQFAEQDPIIIEENPQEIKQVNEIDIDAIEKLSDDEFDEIMQNIKGWNKLVFDSIDDIIDDIFTFNDLLSQKRILSYQSRGENLDDKILDHLNQLIDCGLVTKISGSTYFKMW